jgi:hypothetical protein
LKRVLSLPQYASSDVVYVNENIERNEIRFCDPSNIEDANNLKSYLEKQKYNEFTVTQTSMCDRDTDRNTLQVLLNYVPFQNNGR